jgi:hypothetical protein
MNLSRKRVVISTGARSAEWRNPLLYPNRTPAPTKPLFLQLSLLPGTDPKKASSQPAPERSLLLLLLQLPLSVAVVFCCPYSKPQTQKAHANFQSTTTPLTPTIKWNQTPTVRRKPDCTI